MKNTGITELWFKSGGRYVCVGNEVFMKNMYIWFIDDD